MAIPADPSIATSSSNGETRQPKATKGRAFARLHRRHPVLHIVSCACFTASLLLYPAVHVHCANDTVRCCSLLLNSTLSSYTVAHRGRRYPVVHSAEHRRSLDEAHVQRIRGVEVQGARGPLCSRPEGVAGRRHAIHREVVQQLFRNTCRSKKGQR